MNIFTYACCSKRSHVMVRFPDKKYPQARYAIYRGESGFPYDRIVRVGMGSSLWNLPDDELLSRCKDLSIRSDDVCVVRRGMPFKPAIEFAVVK